MPENEPSPATASGADKPISRLTPEQLEIVSRPAGKWIEILSVGLEALKDGDLRLAEVVAFHVITRAEAGSGGLCKAMFLLSEVYERRRKYRLSDQLLQAIASGRF
jgi:hypothetical protein